MPFPSKKRKSAAIVQDDSDVEADASAKRGKGASSATFQPSTKALVDSDGNRYWEISKSRRVTISDFKGKTLVNVREYYQKDNDWLPGKKGISMSIEQYSAFIEMMPQIEELLKKQGEKIPRPVYREAGPVNGDQHGKAEDDNDEEEEEEAVNERRPNVDATSDEED